MITVIGLWYGKTVQSSYLRSGGYINIGRHRFQIKTSTIISHLEFKLILQKWFKSYKDIRMYEVLCIVFLYLT